MHSTPKLQSVLHSWNLFSLLVCLSMLLALVGPASQTAVAMPPVSSAPSQTESFLQFKSGGHILGFETQRVSLVSLDHALSLTFADSPGVTPRAQTPATGNAAPALEEVSYASIWPGIDAVFGVQEGAVAKSTYIVAPGADPDRIRLRYNVTPTLQADGSLLFTYDSGQMSETPPVAWQEIGGMTLPVEADFALDTQGLVSFALGQYNPAFPLVIDPGYQWHTFYGSQPEFQLTGACPYNGSIGYVVGYGKFYLNLSSLEVTGNMNASGGSEIAVISIDAGGYARKVAFFGSDGDDVANSMVCSGADIYVIGSSTQSWTGPASQAPKHAHSGHNEITVISLSGNSTISSDMTYNWHTFWGSNDNDYGQDIALSGSDLYVSGYSYASWSGSPTAAPLHAYSGGIDMVTMKMTTAGALSWHTFYGSQGDDIGNGISAGNGTQIWIAGTSEATWKGPGNISPIHAHSTGVNTDLTVLALSSTGSYAWHTFFGSTGNDVTRAVAVNSTTGTGFIAGYSLQTWNGPAAEAPLHAYTAGNDIAVLALSSAGAYQWHTFYGGAGSDEGHGIALDPSGNLYIAATSGANWVGSSGQSAIDPYAGQGDIALLKLNAAGEYAWHSFYGSTATDSANDLIVWGGPWVIGYSDGAWNGPAGETPQESFIDKRSGVSVTLNSAGEYIRHLFLGHSWDDTPNNLCADADGNFILVGVARMSWTGPSGQAPLHGFTSSASPDLFALKLSSTGGYLWHTFYGGLGSESAVDVATNSAGDIFLTGTATKTWNGPTGQLPRNPYTGSLDIFALKLNSAGAYQWHTFYGSSSVDSPAGISVSPSGLTFITGYCAQTWNGPSATLPKHPFTAGEDLLVMALTAAGDYAWHTFYGSSGNEKGLSLAEKDGYLYVIGNGPAWTAPNAPLHAHDGTDSNLAVLKLTNLGAYVWHTFYGSLTYGVDIAVDSTSNVYVLASNRYEWNGPAGQLPTHPYAEYAAVVLKLNSNGGYVWHGFFGQTNASMPEELALDAQGGVWAVLEGINEWQAYGVIPPLNPYTDMREIWLLQLDPSGHYKHHTYIGGIGNDESAGVAINADGLVAVGGSSHATWNYRATTNPLHAFNSVVDSFVIAFKPLKDVYIPMVKR